MTVLLLVESAVNRVVIQGKCCASCFVAVACVACAHLDAACHTCVLACMVDAVFSVTFNSVAVVVHIQSPFKVFLRECFLSVLLLRIVSLLLMEFSERSFFAVSLFAIGDTHLSLGTNKPMDIFRGWDNYTERLESHWRKVISERDTVVINGDISWAMRLQECYNDFCFIDSLPGRKIFIKGNHDYWWSTLNKINIFLKENNFTTISVLFNNSYSIGDYSVCGTRGWFYDSPETDKKIILRERQRLIRSIESAQCEPIVFLHYPPVFDDRVCEEIYSVLTDYNIRRCYFGHIHGEKTGRYDNFERDGIKFSLISCDRLNFCPKLIEKF